MLYPGLLSPKEVRHLRGTDLLMYLDETSVFSSKLKAVLEIQPYGGTG